MGQFDISMKHTLADYPDDWARFLGVPKDAEIRVVDTDLSSVTSIADKVLEVQGETRFIVNLEPQAQYDEHIDLRVFEANSRLSKRHKCPVHSCVLVLDKQAWRKENRGYYRSQSPLGGCFVKFHYQVIKVWELPPELLLKAGIGLLPLVPIAEAAKAELPGLVKKMAKRLRAEVSPAVEAELWTATLVLVGLKYDKQFAAQLLQGVQNIMENSSTYQALISKGRAEGVIEGRIADLLLMGTTKLGKPTARVKAAIAKIQDPDRLSVLLTRLFNVSSWQELLADK